MGTKYSTTAVTGYDASPPSDDGSTGAANQVFWSTIKTKLPDPLKTALESIDTKLVTFADLGPVSKSATYSTVAGDHLKTLECSGSFTVSLLDAATAGAGYTVEANNVGTGTVTVSRATGANTINGTAGDLTLLPKNSVTFRCNASANGYNVIAVANNVNADQVFLSVDAGSASGPVMMLDRKSASPAASDFIGEVVFAGRNASATQTNFASLIAQIIDTTAASEDGQLQFRTVVAGTFGIRGYIGNGLVMGSATGGDLGAGTVNAVGVYDDNVLLTCYAIEAETTGKVTQKRWDDATPNAGSKVRKHEAAKRFAARADELLDPKQYSASWKATGHLPAMPSPDEWEAAGKRMPIGDLFQRLWETVEVQAVHIERLRAELERRP